jgi:hypothetical protein
VLDGDPNFSLGSALIKEKAVFSSLDFFSRYLRLSRYETSKKGFLYSDQTAGFSAISGYFCHKKCSEISSPFGVFCAFCG